MCVCDDKVYVRKREKEWEKLRLKKPYFTGVYLLIRFVACFMGGKTSIVGKHFIFSCSSSKKLFISFPGISNI